MTGAPAILPSHRLLEVDFSGIEAVLVGWFIRDPNFIRIAKLGMHAYVTSHDIGAPVDLRASDADVAAALGAVKEAHPGPYNRNKRVVHGTGYGMTPQGMVLMFPQHFTSLAQAQRAQRVYFTCAPGVPKWQQALQRRAHDQTYLGGPPRPGFSVLEDDNAHPYGYRHEFYGVITYKAITATTAAQLERQHIPVLYLNERHYQIVPGPDSKSVIAYYPQSTASGILKEAALTLFDPAEGSRYYIGSAWFGRTPLRAPIHDSLLLEVPWRQWDRVIEATYAVMCRPVLELPMPVDWGLGSHLRIGVEGKAGTSWDQMKKIKDAPQIQAVYSDAPVTDKVYLPATEEEEEDVMDLNVIMAERQKVAAG